MRKGYWEVGFGEGGKKQEVRSRKYRGEVGIGNWGRK
jgi:hypothetical protein